MLAIRYLGIDSWWIFEHLELIDFWTFGADRFLNIWSWFLWYTWTRGLGRAAPRSSAQSALAGVQGAKPPGFFLWFSISLWKNVPKKCILWRFFVWLLTLLIHFRSPEWDIVLRVPSQQNQKPVYLYWLSVLSMLFCWVWNERSQIQVLELKTQFSQKLTSQLLCVILCVTLCVTRILRFNVLRHRLVLGCERSNLENLLKYENK